MAFPEDIFYTHTRYVTAWFGVCGFPKKQKCFGVNANIKTSVFLRTLATSVAPNLQFIETIFFFFFL